MLPEVHDMPSAFTPALLFPITSTPGVTPIAVRAVADVVPILSKFPDVNTVPLTSGSVNVLGAVSPVALNAARATRNTVSSVPSKSDITCDIG